MHSRRGGLEVTQLLLLLGIQPPLTTSLFWRLFRKRRAAHICHFLFRLNLLRSQLAQADLLAPGANKAAVGAVAANRAKSLRRRTEHEGEEWNQKAFHNFSVA